jgi:hypothetical protein
MNKLFGVILTAGLLLSPAVADSHNAIKSCYDALKISGKSEAVEKELFVLIDQTTPLDDSLKNMVIQNSIPFVQHANAFTVAKFSAFIQGNYAGVVTHGQLDWQMPEAQRADTSKPLLQGYDKCMKLQIGYAKKLLNDSIVQTFGNSSSDIAKSDILKSLQEFAKNVIKPSKAKSKVVLIVSDMLENSSITSFYANNSVKKIDPSTEMKKVESSRLVADFGGAKVYVLGAGVMAPNAKNKNNYRDPKTMQALNDFWKMYFQKSNAKLVEFGQPALLGKVE